MDEPSKPQRIFDSKQKEECWNRATEMVGRHKDRWRLDAVGNPVCKILTNCRGPICHQYDHIIPFSKGGKTEVNNCQILQSWVNLLKGNRTDIRKEFLKEKSQQTNFTSYEYDIIEKGIYGDIKRP